MARKSRLDSGGFAYGDIPPGFQDPRHRLPDAPPSTRGRLVWKIAVLLVVLGGIALFAYGFLND